MKMTDFEKYANMCRKLAWEYSSADKMDYDDMEQEAFLIYCECVKRYDVSKSSFSTYLFINLKGRLKLYKNKNKRELEYLQNDEDKTFSKLEYFNPELEPSISELLNDARKILSDVAYSLVEYIFSRNWEGGWYKNFNKKVAKKFLNLSEEGLKPVWNECSNWWNKSAVNLFN